MLLMNINIFQFRISLFVPQEKQSEMGGLKHTDTLIENEEKWIEKAEEATVHGVDKVSM
jgi:hypothetical protein